MLGKQSSIDLIEIAGNSSVQVRTKITVIENGRTIGESLHRHVVAPGDDYSNEDPRVQAVCSVAHTPEIVSAFRSRQQNAV